MFGGKYTTEQMVSVSKDALSLVSVEALEKLRRSFVEDELQKAFKALKGNCLDGDKFDPDKHINNISVLSKVERLDRDFFKVLKDSLEK